MIFTGEVTNLIKSTINNDATQVKLHIKEAGQLYTGTLLDIANVSALMVAAIN
jgi:hypothetical protein